MFSKVIDRYFVVSFRQQYLAGKYWYLLYFVYILHTQKQNSQVKQKNKKINTYEKNYDDYHCHHGNQ